MHIPQCSTPRETSMTEHIVTVLLQNPDHLKVFANSSHADSIMRFLKVEGVELSAKADDPVVMATLQQGSNGAASHYVLTYEFTVSLHDRGIQRVD
jgi:hypothetical protein